MSSALSQSNPKGEPTPIPAEDLSRFSDHESVRSYLVERMRLEIYGPIAEDPEDVQKSFLPVSPLQVFATGSPISAKS